MREVQDLIDFSIHNWYQDFHHVAIKAIILNIPETLLEKFKSDDSHVDLEEVCHSDYIEELKNAINSLNRNAFVKNNWHAPLDARMFSFGNELKVTNISDLMLYLSASNIISADFSQNCNISFNIVLKPWKSIHPASEFRCIVINNILRGISPRDWPTYYEHFKSEGPQIIESLTDFYNENVKEKFRRKHYTFDVIVSYPDKPHILDFGPLNNKTNLYAFSWTEINPLMQEDSPEGIAPIFRFLDSDMGIMTKADAIFKIAKSVATL